MKKALTLGLAVSLIALSLWAGLGIAGTASAASLPQIQPADLAAISAASTWEVLKSRDCNVNDSGEARSCHHDVPSPWNKFPVCENGCQDYCSSTDSYSWCACSPTSSACDHNLENGCTGGETFSRIQDCSGFAPCASCSYASSQSGCSDDSMPKD